MQRLTDFMEAHVYPNEAHIEAQTAQDRWAPVPLMQELKTRARHGGR